MIKRVKYVVDLSQHFWLGANKKVVFVMVSDVIKVKVDFSLDGNVSSNVSLLVIYLRGMKCLIALTFKGNKKMSVALPCLKSCPSLGVHP